MGLLTIIRKQKLKDNEIRCLILGLDNSGKSTIVNQLLPEKERSSKIVPTVGFQIHTIHDEDEEGHKRLISLWDVGGQTTLRPFWDNYFDKTDVLVWCVDISQPFRFNESQRELQSFIERDHDRLGHECRVVLVLNKIDLLKNGHSSVESDEKFNLVERDILAVVGKGDHNVRVVRCSAVSGQGIEELLPALRAD